MRNSATEQLLPLTRPPDFGTSAAPVKRRGEHSEAMLDGSYSVRSAVLHGRRVR
jgi:hypothetical protein